MFKIIAILIRTPPFPVPGTRIFSPAMADAVGAAAAAMTGRGEKKTEVGNGDQLLIGSGSLKLLLSLGNAHPPSGACRCPHPIIANDHPVTFVRLDPGVRHNWPQVETFVCRTLLQFQVGCWLAGDGRAAACARCPEAPGTHQLGEPGAPIHTVRRPSTPHHRAHSNPNQTRIFPQGIFRGAMDVHAVLIFPLRTD